MDIETVLPALLTEAIEVFDHTRRCDWALARLSGEAIQRTAMTHFERLRTESEPFRRTRSEHPRVIDELIREETARRSQSAQAARFHVEPRVLALQRKHQAFVAQCRASADLSFPDALNDFRPADMVMLHLLKESIRPSVEHLSPSELLTRYRQAMEAQDARALVEVELIEARVGRGGLASSGDDLPVVRELREYVAGVQDLRVPEELERNHVPEIIEAALRSIKRADMLAVIPVDPNHPAHASAKEAFEQEQQEFAAAVE